MSLEIYPVVHVTSVDQARAQSNLALESGADGVYLISHGLVNSRGLLHTLNKVSSDNPQSFVGINLLHGGGAYQQQTLMNALTNGEIDQYPDGLWVDDATIEKEVFLEQRKNNPELSRIKYLGGTAFKYTYNFTDDPHKAGRLAREASSYVDVVTTSGEETGSAPNLAKIASMKQSIGEQRLAVASGISVENIEKYMNLADEVLVSTSIEIRPYSGVFRVSALKEIIKKAHQD